MKLYSTKGGSERYSLTEAVSMGVCPHGGLFLPEDIGPLPSSFFTYAPEEPIAQTASRVLSHLIEGELSDDTIETIAYNAFTFSAPLVELANSLYALELFHGPTLAFKDFGARAMAGIMSALKKDSGETLILTATSGDTGGAVAHAFHKKAGFRVVILYPSGKVSTMQERQFTTLGDNITALEVDGTFDDCQALVKKAFNDKALRSQVTLSSANSINIARLLPQICYYISSYKHHDFGGQPVTFSIPSGNFGNLTAALLGKRLGLPIDMLIAATNINKTVPEYLSSAVYTPRKSIETLSNAMDVGAPSNWERVFHLYEKSYEAIIKDIKGFFCSDEETEQAMKILFREYGYICDPHGAIAFLALLREKKQRPGIFLHTAHPGKFETAVKGAIGDALTIPEELTSLVGLKPQSIPLPNDYEALRSFLY